jgi:transcriptional regulator with XRE-family HTH domain
MITFVEKYFVMINRIKYIMEQEDLSPAQFANKIDIQRSRISHILLGRNNPSLDFVRKVLITFPDYDAEWLLFGSNNTNVKSKQNLELSLFEDTEINKRTRDTFVNSYKMRGKDSVSVPDSTEDKIVEKIPTEEIKEEKRLSSIILIYTDGTFKELKAENMQ